MNDSLDLWVTEADAGQRLDRFLVLRASGGGRTQVKGWLSAGRVTVDGRTLKKGDLLRAGQRVRVVEGVDHSHAAGDPTSSSTSEALAGALPLSVVYEDAQLVVVDKPAGLPTHGRDLRAPHTLTARLLARYPEMLGIGYRDNEPGILHRLDNDTSGLLIAARTPESFQLLREALANHRIDKRYLALCAGEVTAPQVFDGFLVSDRTPRVRVSPIAVKRSRPARTEVIDARPVGRTDGQKGEHSLITLHANHAGRHQIRAHLAAAGHPLVGDRLYGGPDIAGLDRHFLHASALRFRHPTTGALLELTSPLPPELARVIDAA